MKNKISKILLVAGLVFISSSVIFLIKQKNKLNQKKEQAIRIEEQLIEEAKKSAKQLEEEVSEEEKEVEVTDIDKEDSIPQSAVGVIRIDKLDVVMPILDNTSEEALIDGAGLLEDTDLPTSKENIITVLAGHRGGSNEHLSFINIDKLDIGDELKITTLEETLYYSVVGSEVIEATDWSKFTRSKDKTKLFLMACHPYPINDKRILIKSELVKAQANRLSN